MAAHQLFKGRELPTLGLGDQISVHVLGCVHEIHSTLTTHGSEHSARKMHFVFFKNRRGRKIRFESESHLECVREIIENEYHHAFQSLFFGETKCLKFDNVFTRKLRTTRSQFDSEVE